MKKETDLRRTIYRIYIIILIAVLTSMFAALSLSYTYLEKANTQSNLRLFDSVNSNVEQVVSEVAAVYSYVINSPDTATVLSLGKYKDYFKVPKSQNISRQLQSYSKNGVNYYIYIQETDTVISPDGIYESSYYYKTIASEYNISYEDWINGIINSSYILLQKNDTSKENSVQYSVRYNDENTLYLSAVIKNSRFLQTKSDEDWVDSCNIYIKEKNGNTILELHNVINDKEKTDMHISKLMFFTTSANLIIEYPKSDFLRPVVGYLKGIGILTIFFLIIDALLMFYLAKRSYNPIRSVLSLLGITEETSRLSDVNRSIKSLLDEKELNVELSKKLSKLQKDKEYEKLILCMSKPCSYEYIKSKLADTDIININSGFCMFSFEIKNLQKLFENSKIADDERYNDLVFILNNISAEIFEKEKCICRCFSTNECIVGIASSKEGKYVDTALVKELLGEITKSVEKFFRISLKYILSSNYEDICSLSDAYTEIKYLIKYKSIMKLEASLCADEIKHNFSNNLKDIFDIDTEKKFINNVSSGNAQDAIFILDTVFDRIRESNLTLVQMKFIISDVSYSFYKISSDLVIGEKKDVLNSFLTKIYFEEDVNACYNLLCSFINLVCRELAQKNTPVTKRGKVDECLLYIKDNYSNSNLNLNIVSVELDVDSGYLSKNFKEQIGCSFNDYLSRLRVEHAKQALRNTNLSVNNIFLESGFTNLRTFNRVFKKYEGVTPTEFRNSVF